MEGRKGVGGKEGWVSNVFWISFVLTRATPGKQLVYHIYGIMMMLDFKRPCNSIEFSFSHLNNEFKKSNYGVTNFLKQLLVLTVLNNDKIGACIFIYC